MPENSDGIRALDELKFQASLADLYRSGMISRPQTRRRQRGSAFVEFVLLFPMLFFLFIGAFDMGFLCYALIATQDAARVGALYTSSQSALAGSSAGACQYVLNELSKMPNSSQFPAGCGAAPLHVTAQAITGPDGKPASSVTVSYQTIQLFTVPIPGFTRQFTISRTVQMRVRT
jgi:Flp pilus assembly protein TadG